MNYEGNIKNTYPINAVRAYETVSRSRLLIPNTQDRTTLNNTLDKFLDMDTLISITRLNPEIARLLAEKGVPLKINLDTFKNQVYNHSKDTKNVAIGIYNNLPTNIKNQANIKDIADAALLHDIGKIFIPQNILTKNNKLTQKEEDIMHLHSTLSYEMMKNQGFNNNVLNIIKYHHQNPKHTGYPIMPQTYKMDINAQVVSLADKYSALREKRSYKNAINEKETMQILHDEMNKGVSSDVYNALNNYVLSTQNKSQNTNTLTNYLNTKNATSDTDRMRHFLNNVIG